MSASMRKVAGIAATRNSREQNRRVALVLVGIMILLVAVSIVTILVKH